MSGQKVQVKFPGSDKVCIAINDDGTGFIYYPNGKFAVAISPGPTDYQKSFYAFDKDRNGTILAGIDIFGCGFMVSSTRKSASLAENKKQIVVLTKVGAIISENDVTVYEWIFNKPGKGRAPNGKFTVILNEHIEISFLDTVTIMLKFNYEGIQYEIDLGAKQKRNDNYLMNATRLPDGRLVPKIPNYTLQDRQKEFTEKCKAQFNKLNPKSENLDLVKEIVSGLEVRFDGICDRMHTLPSCGSEWKEKAFSSTLREIPRIPISGSECGNLTGLGEHLYIEPDLLKTQKTLPDALVTSTGKWKNEIDIMAALRELNPPLKRNNVLKCNSGRYTNMMVIAPERVTAQNPTGMVVPIGKPVPVVTWNAVKEENKELLMQGMSSSQTLISILLVRNGTNVEKGYERVANISNLMLSEGPINGVDMTGKFRLNKIEIGENSSIIGELGIKELPSFIMFYGGKLVYAGTAGGKRVKSVSSVQRPQILLIENNVRHQINLEKSLRNYGCDTYLCLSVKEGLERIKQFKLSNITFDLILVSDEVPCHDIDQITKFINADLAVNRTVIVALMNMLGDTGHQNLHAVRWSESFHSDNLDVLLPNNLLNKVATIAVQKPIKNASIAKALSYRVLPSDDAYLGITPDSLINKMNEVRENAINGKISMSSSFGATTTTTNKNNTAQPYIGLRMSIEETKIRGRALTKM